MPFRIPNITVKCSSSFFLKAPIGALMKGTKVRTGIFLASVEIVSLSSDALRDLVPFVLFKKLEKHSWRSVNKRSSMDVFHVFKIVHMVQSCANITSIKC